MLRFVFVFMLISPVLPAQQSVCQCVRDKNTKLYLDIHTGKPLSDTCSDVEFHDSVVQYYRNGYLLRTDRYPLKGKEKFSRVFTGDVSERPVADSSWTADGKLERVEIMKRKHHSYIREFFEGYLMRETWEKTMVPRGNSDYAVRSQIIVRDRNGKVCERRLVKSRFRFLPTGYLKKGWELELRDANKKCLRLHRVNMMMTRRPQDFH